MFSREYLYLNLYFLVLFQKEIETNESIKNNVVNKFTEFDLHEANNKLEILKIRYHFISYILDKKISLTHQMNKRKNAEELFVELKYPKINGSYNYLSKMSLGMFSEKYKLYLQNKIEKHDPKSLLDKNIRKLNKFLEEIKRIHDTIIISPRDKTYWECEYDRIYTYSFNEFRFKYNDQEIDDEKINHFIDLLKHHY